MELIKQETIASVSLYELKLSESELMIYEACIKYMIEHCDEKEIMKHTECTKEELGWRQEDLQELITKYVLEEYLPDRFTKND